MVGEGQKWGKGTRQARRRLPRSQAGQKGVNEE